jgi:hypothetical protein
MIYCSGPGSALGLRAVSISLKTLTIFGKKTFELFEYDSLNMGLSLNPDFGSIYTYATNGNLLLRVRGEENNIIPASDDIPRDKSIFLDTRHVRNVKYVDFVAANYDIGSANFDILSICQPASGDLRNYGNDTYKKWNGMRKNFE